MKGFESKFRDFPQYVRGVSQEFWLKRRLGQATRTYLHPQLILRDAQGIGQGPEAMRAQILASQAMLADQERLCEDVIWSGTPQVGMLGSARSLVRARHLGAGIYGQATGRDLSFRAMMDLYAKDNRISEIWQVSDTGAIFFQLGVSPTDWAARVLPHLDVETEPYRPELDGPGAYTGAGNENQWGKAYAEMIEGVMKGDPSVLAAQYDPACQGCYADGVEGVGPAAAERFWLGLRQAFPTARFEIKHRIGMEEALLPPRAALRWSLDGTHDGWSAFGAPSGAAVHVMGIAQVEFGPWGLRREWAFFDSAAIWLQIRRHTG